MSEANAPLSRCVGSSFLSCSTTHPGRPDLKTNLRHRTSPPQAARPADHVQTGGSAGRRAAPGLLQPGGEPCPGPRGAGPPRSRAAASGGDGDVRHPRHLSPPACGHPGGGEALRDAGQHAGRLGLLARGSQLSPAAATRSARPHPRHCPHAPKAPTSSHKSGAAPSPPGAPRARAAPPPAAPKAVAAASPTAAAGTEVLAFRDGRGAEGEDGGQGQGQEAAAGGGRAGPGVGR
jgi:hypothetical protein